MATSFQQKKGCRWGRLSGLRHRRSPWSFWDAGLLHVEEERARSAARRQLTLALLGVLSRLLAVLATHREGQRAQPLLRDFVSAVEAVAVGALLETRERVRDLAERLGLHLHQGELELFLDVGFGAFDRVEHFVQLAAPAALFTDAAHLTLHFGVDFTTTLVEHVLEVGIAGTRRSSCRFDFL